VTPRIRESRCPHNGVTTYSFLLAGAHVARVDHGAAAAAGDTSSSLLIGRPSVRTAPRGLPYGGSEKRAEAMGLSGMDEVDKVTSGHGVAAEIVAIADDWARAIAGNDAERIAGVMADEWVIVSESGISTKEDFLSMVRSGALTHSAMNRITHPRIRVYGDTAVLTARVTNTAHYGGERFDADEWTTDVFVLRNGRWRCVLSQITPAAAG